MKKGFALFFVGLAVAALGIASSAEAVTTLDLTAGAGTSGFLNTAFFAWTDLDHNSTGSGVLDPFVRIQANGTEQGYNTDNPPVFNEKTNATDTHSLLLSSVPIVTLNGIQYREFLLDVGEGGGNNFLSLDQIKIWLRPTGGDTTTTLASFGTPLFDLDGNGDNTIKLKGSLNPGNGKGDMFAYIPNSLFGGSDPYVLLYSQFGTNFSSDGSFEEWAVCHTAGGCTGLEIPEPSSLSLLGIGLLGFWKRRRSKKA